MGEYVTTWNGRTFYRRSPEELAAEKAKRNAATMHCQCCGRDILANKGKIAHHGYERPGTGWQTSSCMGARALPFEAARDRLGDMIGSLKDHLRHLKVVRADAVAEKYPLRFDYVTYGDRLGYGLSRPQIDRHVEFTRETFDMVRVAYHREYFRFDTYDDAKKREIAEIDGRITATKRTITESQKRYDGWKKTHTWKNKLWAKI